MAKRSYTLKVYARTLKRDVTRNARRLVVVRRARKGQLVITLNRPTFKTSRNYFRKWRAKTNGTVRRQKVSVLGGIGLLLFGLVGTGFALTQLSSMQMSSVTAVKQVEAKQAVEAPAKPAHLARSMPVKLTVPDVGIDTSLIQLGQNEDGSLEVPESYDVAGWYTGSPTPGEVGPSIIVGHVDNYQGAAVFYRLKELRPGQMITINREDGSVANFSVTQVAQFDQNNFPTDAVYGNIDHAGLRLITCGGPFDQVNQRYTQNTVIYAAYITPETL